MKKLLFLLGLLAASSLTGVLLFKMDQGKSKEIKILLLYSKNILKNHQYVINAYKSVLKEEGVPFKLINTAELLSRNPKQILKTSPAILIPDGACQILPIDAKFWMGNYVRLGGNILVAYDGGTKNIKGAYLKLPLFSDLTGVNYCLYRSLKNKAYTLGNFVLSKEGLKLLEATPGKFIKGKLEGYMYGTLQYPVAINKRIRKKLEILSYVKTKEGKTFIGASLNQYGKGTVLYVNLPLGHLKAYSDDLPLRMFLRAFLFKITRIPHLMNVPFGKGGLVINWHIDANPEWVWLPKMLRNGYFPKGIEFSFHITAGPFCYKPGDGEGFDACGRGRKLVEELMKHGTIGSHGGWGHNWFSENILNGTFGEKEIYRYIEKNNKCLESITGYKIREYAAPNGVHPQPITTKILEKLGFNSYYYPGDSGSSPNRTFFSGKMVSKKVIAFPIVPFGKCASLYEISEENYSSKEVEKWLKSVANFCTRNRVVRLIYSHPYDVIPHYPDAVKHFVLYAKKLSDEGKLLVKPMSYFADFLLRFLKTKYVFQQKNGQLKVSIYNPEGLKGITLAIPKEMCKIKGNCDENYCYIVIKNNSKRFSFVCSDH